MRVLQQILKDLASQAKSLESLGLQEVAWTKQDALRLIQCLDEQKIAILGGDVYNRTLSGRLTPAYENWFCERCEGEALRDYAERSQRKANIFLSTCSDSPNILFTLVLKEYDT